MPALARPFRPWFSAPVRCAVACLVPVLLHDLIDTEREDLLVRPDLADLVPDLPPEFVFLPG